ncbi:replication protein A 70 kDa DNA-binding subunit B-like [Prosopis cineraria]|uniref:replication protein A 70 kDa DNA-binding subunit B-like n=1 Tax=Prosopis cineraria TaxID=364024 RepID=UPI00240FCB25|nr:replication protein A 70 kDa DNA-binding subunit B-like [Prosopis cineraria]
MSQFSKISNLHDGTDRWRICGRVVRKWNVFHKIAPSDLFCITMILVDEEGNKIQASMLNKSLLDHYRQRLVEGQSYFIANFEVSLNNNQYKATTHPFKITFSQQTFVKDEVANIPPYKFDFLPLSEIMKQTESSYIDYLFDAVGLVTSIGGLEEYRKDNETKNKLRMVLSDNEGHDVECILFDECSTNAFMNHLEITDHPAVAVFNLARIGFSEDGRPQICSSFNATRVSFNPSIKEVKDLILSAKDRSPVIGSSSQFSQSQSTTPTVTSMMNNNRRISIAEIHDQEAEGSFLIFCTVVKLETRHGWTYDGCAKCATKPKEVNESLYCPNCKKKPQSIEPKLKIHYTVADKSRKASVIFWDKLAVQLIQRSAAEMKLILNQEERAYDFPDQLDSIIGKKLLLKLKINQYNKDFPNSSISVTQYTECEDLTGQFNDASQEVNGQGATGITQSGMEDIDCTVVETPAPEKIIASQVVGLDDLTITQIASKLPIKGKRKIACKRISIPQKEVKSNEVLPSSSSSSVQKPMKVIKQEKS